MTFRALLLALLCLPSLASADVWRFDFGLGDAPLQDGYRRVTRDTLYSLDLGFGWAPVDRKWHDIEGKPAAIPGKLPGLFDRDRGGPSALHRDLVMAVREYHPLVQQQFLLDVPSGDFEVAVLSGDEGYRSGAFRVVLEDHEPMDVPVRAPGQFVEVVGSAHVTDGQLSITFDADEYWTVNALLVYPLSRSATVREEEAAFFSYTAGLAEGRARREELRALPLHELQSRCVPLLNGICQWAIEHDLGSNVLKDVNDTPDSIFINGNLARTLLSAYVITGEDRYRDEALRWCDQFISEQVLVKTSGGNQGGWWSDVGPNRNIYLADTGTATSALVYALRFMDTGQRQRSLASLERFARFVREGTQADPQDRGRAVCDGWVIQSGPNRGALGCGYYRGHLSTEPYTISSSTAGCLMFSQLFTVTGNPEYRQVAVDAARWVLSLINDDGTVPYIIDGETGTSSWWLVATYAGEGLMAVHDLIADEPLRRRIRDGIDRIVRRAVREQSTDGIWGKPRDFDGQRSGLVAQLLSWQQLNAQPSDEIKSSLKRHWSYMLTPELAGRYGINVLVRPTGFIGLAAADLIKPGVTLECGYLGTSDRKPSQD